MAESAEETSIPPSPSPPLTAANGKEKDNKAWYTYISEDLPLTVQQSTDSALRSARSFQHTSSTYFRDFQEFMPQLRTQYKNYEDAFFHRVKDELISAREHPAVAGGIAATVCLLLMRGPRRLLFRHTLGRFRSEEAQFVRAEKNVKGLNLSVDLMKKESKKLLERAALAERDMLHGQSELVKVLEVWSSLSMWKLYQSVFFASLKCMTGHVKHLNGNCTYKKMSRKVIYLRRHSNL